MDITQAQATILAVILAGSISFLVQVLTSKRASGGKASEAEVTVRGQWIRDMQERVRDLESALSKAWEREQEAARKHRDEISNYEHRSRESFARYQRDMDAIDQRWRHLVRNMLTREAYVRRLLTEFNVPEERIPPFRGLEQFEEEGGDIEAAGFRIFQEDPDPSSPLILIVDDNTQLGQRSARQLEMAGYRSRFVGSGAEAMHCLESEAPPDLILLDIVLGDTDGVRLAARMRHHGYSGPLLAITGGSRLMDPDMLAPAHFAELLQKPVPMADLLEAVRRHLPRTPPLLEEKQ